jgi:hypothetical protein
MRKIIDSTTSYVNFVKSVYTIKIIAQLVDVIPVFIKQLSMNWFLFRTRDDDGEIMVIESLEEKPEPKPKKCKPKVGVPRSIRIKQLQAIESAQAGVNGTNGSANGSIGKPSGPNKKK